MPWQIEMVRARCFLFALLAFLPSGISFTQNSGGWRRVGRGLGRSEIRSYTYNLENYDYVILPKKMTTTKLSFMADGKLFTFDDSCVWRSCM